MKHEPALLEMPSFDSISSKPAARAVRSLAAAGIGAALALLWSAEARAATITVETTATGLNNDVDCGLAEAIAVVNARDLDGAFGCSGANGSNDTIVVPAGVYTLPGVVHDLNRSMAIVGAGSGTGAGATVIRLGGYIGLQVNSTHFPTVELENLTLTKDPAQTGQVTALWVNGDQFSTNITSLVLNRVEVSGFDEVRAIMVTSGADVDKGQGTAQLFAYDSVIKNNHNIGIEGSGGADIKLTRVTVSDNFGSGIALFDGADAYLYSSHVERNTADGATANHGGGIYVTSEGPGWTFERSHLFVERSLVANNTAAGDGGGIFYAGKFGLAVFNSTVSGNTAGVNGGGIAYEGNPGYSFVMYSTVASNNAANTSSTGKGGGFYHSGGGTGSPQFWASLVAKNTRAGSPASSLNGADIYTPNTVDGAYGLVGTKRGWLDVCADFGGTDCTIMRPVNAGDILDPLIGPLTPSGGGTRVHPLLPGSPALDYVIPNVTENTDDDVDQRRLSRPVDADASASGTERDIGAYELGGYELLGGTTFQAPAAITYAEAVTGTKYVELFVTGTDNNIYSKSAELRSNGWLEPWSSYYLFSDGNTAKPPSVIAHGNNEAYLFTTDSTSRVRYRKRLSNYTLASWVDLGKPSSSVSIASAPAALTAQNEIWVFARASNDQLYYRRLASGTWSAWSSIGTTTFTNEPASVYLGDNDRVYVFGRKSSGGTLVYKSCVRTSCSWPSGWTSVDSTPVSSSPAVAAPGANRIQLFAKNNFNELVSNTLVVGGSWSGWVERPTSNSFSAVGASARNDGNTADVFMTLSGGVVERQQTP